MINVKNFAGLRRFVALAAMALVVPFAFAEDTGPGADDIAYTLVDGDETATKTYYDSLDALFDSITNTTTVVVIKDCAADTFTSPVTLTNNVTVRSETGALYTLTLSKDAAFTIPEGVEADFTEISITRSKAGEAPFKVTGGKLSFGAGAKVYGIAMTGTGNAVRVESGVFAMSADAVIENCTALTTCKGLGGAVYLAGSGASFEFTGGIISGCTSRNRGGAVYAEKGALVTLSGSVTAIGNEALLDPATGDFYFAATAGDSDDPALTVAGALTGEVGINYEGRNDLAASFALIDASLDPADVVGAFKNNANTALYAAASDDGKSLVWSETPADDAAIEPLPDATGAEAKVVSGFVTKYYAKAGDALAVAVDGSTVVLLKDAELADSVSISAGIVLDGAGFTLSRSGAFTIDVGTSSLAVTNITLDGSSEAGRFFNVGTGSLVFESDATLRNVVAADADFVAPIVVWGGTFTMNGGVIENCRNDFVPMPGGALTAGAVAVSGGEAYFNGGLVTKCVGSRAGGVCIYNEARAYVKDSFIVLTNETPAGVVCNMVVQDLSRLTVTDDVTGKIGCYDGYLANTNIAAYVDAAFAASATADELAASAFKFRNDILNVKAVPVTNGSETLFVWRTAMGGNTVFTNTVDGVSTVYDLVESDLVDEDYVVCPPFAFTAIVEADDKASWTMTIKPVEEYCSYDIYASDDLETWTKVFETGVLAPGTVVDGEYTFTSPAAGDRRFWRAVGKDGLK